MRREDRVTRVLGERRNDLCRLGEVMAVAQEGELARAGQC